MPRWVLVAAAVGVFALFASSSFALARSWQLQRSEERVAALESELSEARERAREPQEPPDSDPDNPLGDLFGDSDGLGDLFGDNDAAALAQCMQAGPAPGSFEIPQAGTEAQVQAIAEAVEQLRDLEFQRQPEPVFLTGAEIADRVAETIDSEYGPERAEEDRRILAALGAIEPELDLREFQAEFLGGQVAGFYDPDTGELVVRAGRQGDSLSPSEQVTLAHELDHALTDQHLELPIEITEDETDSDHALAALSVIEGDATLAMQHYALAGLSLEDQLELNLNPDALDAQRQLGDAPHYLAQSLQFPYLAGLAFTCNAHAHGGWSAVDELYDRLPTTTAEIMDPRRYGTPAGKPGEPAAPGGPWEHARTTTIGAAELQWLFEAPGDDRSESLDNVRDLALGWTGGRLDLWTDGDRSAVAVALIQQEPGGPLCEAVDQWYGRASPDAADANAASGERRAWQTPEQSAVLTCPDAAVRLGIGPDLKTARLVVQPPD